MSKCIKMFTSNIMDYPTASKHMACYFSMSLVKYPNFNL